MPAPVQLSLLCLPGNYAVCRLPPGAAIPVWAAAADFSSVTRTPEELSIVTAESAVPAGVLSEGGFRLLRVAGQLGFSAVGILAALVVPLAEAGIPVLSLSTFDTDYLLVRGDRLGETSAALRARGHSVEEPS